MDWSWDPTEIAGLAVLALAYLWIQRWWPARARQQRYFWAGFLVLFVALLSPIDYGADYSFAVHMIQHMLLLMVAPPLLVLGTPPQLMGFVYQRPRLRTVYRFLWSPVAATVLYNGLFVAWHVPLFYDATLRNDFIHACEHTSFVAVGMVFWGIIAAPSTRLAGASIGTRIGMLLGADVVNFMLSFTLAFSNSPFYAPYVTRPHLWGLTPVADQRLGGLIMWVMGQILYAVPLLVLLYWFLSRGERTESVLSS